MKELASLIAEVNVKDLVRDRTVSFDWEAKLVVIIHCWLHASQRKRHILGVNLKMRVISMRLAGRILQKRRQCANPAALGPRKSGQ